ncbi:MAG: 2'-5' RNA ligase family protein [Acutalibacteraceae bacterium]|nr:2'-5' RNA ligase family protein [Acutalibacteraceae bacterium]
MKATIALISNNKSENFERKMMLEANKHGGMGFEMARLPQHVSLKQPFSIPNLEEMETFFDSFVKELSPFEIEFVDMDLFPSNVLDGVPSGYMSLRVKKTPELSEVQKKLNEGLYKKFGPCPADHDNDYIFHMTFAIGGASFESYQKAYNKLKKQDYKKSFLFSKLGLLYYDDDNITPGTYFCYKVCDI